MKIDVNAKITTMKDEDINADIDGKQAPLTLGVLAKSALLNEIPDDKLTGVQRHHYAKMAENIDKAMCNGGSVEIDAGEVEIIKQRIGKVATTWTLYRAWNLIESAESKSKADAQDQPKP